MARIFWLHGLGPLIGSTNFTNWHKLKRSGADFSKRRVGEGVLGDGVMGGLGCGAGVFVSGL